MEAAQLEIFKEIFFQLFPEAEEMLACLLTAEAITEEAQKVRAIRARVKELRKAGQLRSVCACNVAKEFGCTYDHVVSCMKSHNAFGEFVGRQKKLSW